MNQEAMERLALALHRSQAVVECRNVMGRYSLYNAQVRRKDLVGLFSNREDVWVRMPWGYYSGPEGVRNRYLREQGDRSDPAVYQKFCGKTVIHPMNTELMEVSADGKTARGAWISPGQDTGRNSDGSGEAMWCWSKFYVEFILEEGQWKLWHFALYHMYRTPYDRDFLDYPFTDYAKMFGQTLADRPSDVPVWELGQPYPADQPDPRLPGEAGKGGGPV